MRKILIIDDEPGICLLYKEELTEEGYDIVSSNTCCGIIKVIAKQKPDLIILDIKIGDANSLDVLQDIRNDYKEIPVILCTAYPAFKYDLKSIAADDYVIKSHDLTELKAKIKTAIERGTCSISISENEESSTISLLAQ